MRGKSRISGVDAIAPAPPSRKKQVIRKKTASKMAA
jgi:hypothetical protein